MTRELEPDNAGAGKIKTPSPWPDQTREILSTLNEKLSTNL
jgi:hypothetical protein